MTITSVIFLVVFLSIFFTGLFLLLHAIWKLRGGLIQISFIKRGMLGIGLIVLATIAPYVFMYANSLPSVSIHVILHIPRVNSSFKHTIPSTVPPIKK